MSNLYDVITAAIKDFAEHGFDREERLRYWLAQIRQAAVGSLVPEHLLQEALQRSLGVTYRKMVEQQGLLKYHKGVSRFTLAKVQPQLRAELDRRIMASANLIKLNREAAIEKTLQRFSGWASSIPTGGSDAVDKLETKTSIRKALKQLPFEERRVAVDQGHKFIASLNNIVATSNGALALTWHSHWRQPGYNYRKDHKERDGKVYAIRGNWAMERGLMKKGAAGYYDDITAVGEEVFCRCSAQYLYALRDLPADMLTQKGAEALAEARAKIKSLQ